MPDTGAGDMRTPPRTLAEKLSALRDEMTPKGGKAPSWDKVGKMISEQTQVPISGAYLWELATGKPGTNPKLNHLKALAEFFDRRISYFVDETIAFEDDEKAQLELLAVMKRLGVRDLRLDNVGSTAPGPETVADLLGRLQTLDLLADSKVREIALNVRALSAEHREVIGKLVEQPELLNVLGRAGALLPPAGALSDDQLTVAVDVLERPDLIQALSRPEARHLALESAELLASSREAILAMIGQMKRLEAGKA
ncbi:hypothetical protein [Streptomyces albipurpureus]|uniref:XRE family transcriptional regulator n=1 Tax=Streptomyces albipurpureus TaxID=2897419 RepID=A0ABT0UJJ5_9ACTN|nr:hypothetical protein [Streptomyces sp. CWNU-1]MCM2388822.1 hypothetical protein [Streptomyces sp. CWNU-1]